MEHHKAVSLDRADRIAELERINANLLLQAQCWAMEAKTMNSIVMDCYRAVGCRLGNWHGALPIQAAIRQQSQENGK